MSEHGQGCPVHPWAGMILQSGIKSDCSAEQKGGQENRPDTQVPALYLIYEKEMVPGGGTEQIFQCVS